MALHKGFGQIPVHDEVPHLRTTNGPTNLRDSASQPYVKTKDAQILVNDGSNDRVVIGQRGDGTFGIKVSKPGTSASTGTNDQMVLNSDFNTFKIIATGFASETLPNPTVSGTTYTITIPHNLGVAPAFHVYINVGGAWGFAGNVPTPWLIFGGTTNIRDIIAGRSDNTNFYIDVYVQENNSNASGLWTFKYYILQETAN